MDEDEILRSLAGSLEDEVIRSLQEKLASNTPIYIPREYEYLILSSAPVDGAARVYVSKEGVMTRAEIAAQLRRLADYVESLTDEQAHRP
jgi:hypothetical protein